MCVSDLSFFHSLFLNLPIFISLPGLFSLSPLCRNFSIKLNMISGFRKYIATMSSLPRPRCDLNVVNREEEELEAGYTYLPCHPSLRHTLTSVN